VLRQGPLPLFAHGLLEYAAAVLLIAAPFLFNFHSGAATAASIIIGVLVLVMAATTVGSTSLVNSLPLAAHVVFDYVLAALLIAAPFLFSFSKKSGPTAFVIVLGVVHLLVTIGTRFRSAE
jgi:hypothetical protein